MGRKDLEVKNDWKGSKINLGHTKSQKEVGEKAWEKNKKLGKNGVYQLPHARLLLVPKQV